MLKVLDLFSGIGGFSLGLEATGGFETVGFCEIEPYPRAVLAKHWPDVPIYDDVRTLQHDGPIDVICGGYPCQPFSVAGKRRGAEDDRHLWPSMFALIQKHRPAWVIGENVAGHINMGLDEVLSDLEGEGYAARAFVIPACAVDAPHRRGRVWIVAHAGHSGVHERRERHHAIQESSFIRGDDRHGLPREPQVQNPVLAHADNDSIQEVESYGFDPQGRAEQIKRPPGPRIASGGRFWLPEPDMGRVAHGVPNRAHRIKALGNAVVPQVVTKIGYAILAAEEDR